MLSFSSEYTDMCTSLHACRLKSLLQLMAAAVADRDVAYFTFGDCKLQKELSSLHSSLVKHGITVGQVCVCVCGIF